VFKTSCIKFIDSFKLMKILIQNKDKLLEPIAFNEELMNTQFYDKATVFKTLEYPESCTRYEDYKEKDPNQFFKVFFDFETTTNEERHKPYLVRYETEDGEQREFIGENCALDMLNNLPNKENIMLIAHNANYDSRFILKYLTNEKPIVKGSRFLAVSAKFFRNCEKHNLSILELRIVVS
jgi:hypothetical protein